MTSDSDSIFNEGRNRGLRFNVEVAVTCRPIGPEVEPFWPATLRDMSQESVNLVVPFYKRSRFASSNGADGSGHVTTVGDDRQARSAALELRRLGSGLFSPATARLASDVALLARVHLRTGLLILPGKTERRPAVVAPGLVGTPHQCQYLCPIPNFRVQQGSTTAQTVISVARHATRYPRASVVRGLPTVPPVWPGTV